MLLTYPEVQACIHAELDEVVGKGTAVTLEHRDALAYIEAVILETLRMYPLLPFSVPHMCTKDASLGGYTLSKGTCVTYLRLGRQHRRLQGCSQSFVISCVSDDGSGSVDDKQKFNLIWSFVIRRKKNINVLNPNHFLEEYFVNSSFRRFLTLPRFERAENVSPAKNRNSSSVAPLQESVNLKLVSEWGGAWNIFGIPKALKTEAVKPQKPECFPTSLTQPPLLIFCWLLVRRTAVNQSCTLFDWNVWWATSTTFFHSVRKHHISDPLETIDNYRDRRKVIWWRENCKNRWSI